MAYYPEYARAYYLAHREKSLAESKKWHAKNKAQCLDCGAPICRESKRCRPCRDKERSAWRAREFVCRNCKKTYFNKRHRKDGEGEKYCSRQCASADMVNNHYCGNRHGWIKQSKLLTLYYHSCLVCGALFRPISRDVTCSQRCNRKRNNLFQGAAQDRARKLGRKFQRFSIFQIFERDKWRCQLCGIRTPKRLRGTQAPNAPQLDHIIPLAKGGHHVIENVQLLCRKCNQTKHARSVGQLWLLPVTASKPEVFRVYRKTPQGGLPFLGATSRVERQVVTREVGL